jgi:lipopolysaccharide/colanic/teichoic acid biosynthesis glycosyltransferase
VPSRAPNSPQAAGCAHHESPPNSFSAPSVCSVDSNQEVTSQSMHSSTIEYSNRAAGGALQRVQSSGVPSWKRGLDLFCILLALPVLLPVGLVLAALIKAVSSGPVLFKQERVGYRGRRFLCFKFRTMKVGADTGVHKGHLNNLMNSNQPMVKLDCKGDSRLIPFGLILRSLGLDELPQLLNVIRGEMSLVGPRPCIPYEFEQFLPRHRRRCDTLPGLTGWWQVNGKNRLSFERMIELDLEYVEKKSLWMDVKILFRTVPAVLAQAYEVKIKNRSARKA